MKNKSILSAMDITLIALFTALIAVCSFITVPVGTVPFTLQTFAVFVAAGLLGARRGTLSVVAYIIIGAIGIPVFSKMTGGVGVLTGPTGGFIIGFILTALIIGLLPRVIKVGDKRIKLVVLFISMLLGDAVCFAIGTVQFMVVMDMGLSATLGLCVIPFIIPDLAKMVVAIIVVDRVKKYVHI